MTALPGVWALLAALKECLCEEIARSGRPVCFCAVVPGSQAILEYASGGQAWVRLASAFPSNAFPSPAGTESKCYTPLAWQVEVGIARCVPVESPTEEDQSFAAEIQVADMELMRRAIACCMGAEDDYSYVLGTYQPSGPTGDIVAGVWSLLVQKAS
jgi:hypothetical protein